MHLNIKIKTSRSISHEKKTGQSNPAMNSTTIIIKIVVVVVIIIIIIIIPDWC